MINTKLLFVYVHLMLIFNIPRQFYSINKEIYLRKKIINISRNL